MTTQTRFGRLIGSSLLLVASAGLVACKEIPTTPTGNEPAPPTVALGDQPIDLNLPVGNRVQLVFTGPAEHEGFGILLGLSFYSSDPEVAAVSRTGLLKALKAGSAQVVAERFGKVALARVTVLEQAR